MKGKLITFEGFEGSGKSTQARLLYRYLKGREKSALHIREPGGIKISEEIRRILLDVKNVRMTDSCETLLYMAARAQLVDEVIAPALKKGTIVICDRFLDSTVVYQGYGHGVDIGFIKRMGKFVTQGVKPDLTFVFDIEVKKGLSRTGKIRDRIEKRPMGYHHRVRRGYLAIARQEPKRIKLIKADGSRAQIQSLIREHVNRLLK